MDPTITDVDQRKCRIVSHGQQNRPRHQPTQWIWLLGIIYFRRPNERRIVGFFCQEGAKSFGRRNSLKYKLWVKVAEKLCSHPPLVKKRMSRTMRMQKKSQRQHREGSTGSSSGTRNFRKCRESARLGVIMTLRSSGCNSWSVLWAGQKKRHLPERPAKGPCNWHIRVDLGDVRRVGDLRNNTFDDANVAIEGSIKTPAT